MEVKNIQAVYSSSSVLVGILLLDEQGNPMVCSSCGKGTMYTELATGLTKCTLCTYCVA